MPSADLPHHVIPLPRAAHLPPLIPHTLQGGWELHLSAFCSLLAQPAYAPLLAAAGAELGPSALPTSRRLVQEVRLTGIRRQGGTAGVTGGGGSGGGGSCRLVFQLGMQANGCWVVEAIRRVADS